MMRIYLLVNCRKHIFEEEPYIRDKFKERIAGSCKPLYKDGTTKS
jgi:hypothetical protein